MKRVYLILISFALIGTGFQSCSKDDDLFDDGDARDIFLGSWSVVDECTKQSYRSTISYDPSNSAQVLISNYANLNKAAKAVVAGNSIVIESQDIGNGYTVSGYGKLSLNGEIINWTSHNFETTGDLTECTATYTKTK